MDVIAFHAFSSSFSPLGRQNAPRLPLFATSMFLIAGAPTSGSNEGPLDFIFVVWEGKKVSLWLFLLLLFPPSHTTNIKSKDPFVKMGE